MEAVTGVRNSAGTLSEVLSTVMDLPCGRGGVCNWEVGVENTLFGGVAKERVLSAVGAGVVIVGLDLSTDARGGGGGIRIF